jgi:hypothetical protein
MATNVWQLAIISESKLFLSSNPFQRVVESVYYGRVVYTPNSWFAIIPENYKRGGISLYDPRKASILNQNRLIVPRTRHIIEVCQYIILIMLYVMTMINRNYGQFTGWEVAFLTYTAGWCLNEFASTLEHGWHVHTRNLWSYLDMLFITIYCTYFVIRMHGRAIRNDKEARQALDILACAAPILFSRIAFNLMPENILFLTLRAMVRDFFGFMLITVWCCSGFLVSLLWLSQWEAPEPKSEPPSFFTITEWMLWIFFGLDGTGISRSVDIHRILGPTLMITFALLGNILFFAIIVSMLGNTFSRVVSSANMEIQFRHAVLTYEGVKSDGIFAYRPPFNLLAPFVLLPLKFILSPRWFHKVHVTTVRVLNAPILLCVNYYERRRLWKHKFVKRVARKSVFNFSQFSVQGNVQAVFSVEPPREMADELEEEDILDGDILDLGFRGKLSVGD